MMICENQQINAGNPCWVSISGEPFKVGKKPFSSIWRDGKLSTVLYTPCLPEFCDNFESNGCELERKPANCKNFKPKLIEQ